MDTRDGENVKNNIKIRISSRIGRKKTYSAQNVGFRCAQAIKDDENVEFGNEEFKVVRLRPPVRHDRVKIEYDEEL